MVSIQYIGRTFNNVFQYVFANLVAQANGLKVMTAWNHPETIAFKNKDEGDIFLDPVVIEDRFTAPRDSSWLTPGKYAGKHVRVFGYFQYADLYDTRRDFVKSLFDLSPISKEHKDDIVFHVRLGDYINVTHRPIIDPVWYYSVLKNNELLKKNIYCVMENPRNQWENDYIKKLKILIPNVKIQSTDIKNDWNFIRQFGTILCSNSSFCWWAAFLSEADKIFTFRKWLTGSPAVTLADTKGWHSVDGKYYFE